MVQTLKEQFDGVLEKIELPHPSEEVMPGVYWGLCHAPFTPAYWVAQWWYARRTHDYADYRQGASLREEVAACLLGGHGITAEMNNAAFLRLRERGFLDVSRPSVQALADGLSEPLMVDGRLARYRFPKQKAKFLHFALVRLGDETPPNEDIAFRSWLLNFPGIGLKTASWITRNWLHSNQVAIIDVHVFRAATIAGIFRGVEQIPRDYKHLENRFLQFAEAVKIEASRLDVFMWRHMKDLGAFAIGYFNRQLSREI